MAGLEDYKSLFSHPPVEKVVAEKYLVWHFLCIRGVLWWGVLANVFRTRGLDTQADVLI